MYAVIESGSKQYRVELGQEIQVDRLDVQPGDSIKLDRVLLIADGDDTAIGQPVVEGATVSADVLGQDRGEKLIVFKYKPKARTRVKKGFRAELTTLRISDIAFGGKSAAKDAKKADAEKAKSSKAAEKAAKEQASADEELAAKLAGASEPATSKASDAAPEAEAEAKSTTKAKTTKAAPRKKAAAKVADPAPAEANADADAPPADADAVTTDDTKADDTKADDTKKDE